MFEYGRIECQFILQLPLCLFLNLTSRLHYTLIARLAPGSSLNTRPILYQVRIQSNPVYLITTGTEFAGAGQLPTLPRGVGGRSNSVAVLAVGGSIPPLAVTVAA